MLCFLRFNLNILQFKLFDNRKILWNCSGSYKTKNQNLSIWMIRSKPSNEGANEWDQGTNK